MRSTRAGFGRGSFFGGISPDCARGLISRHRSKVLGLEKSASKLVEPQIALRFLRDVTAKAMLLDECGGLLIRWRLDGRVCGEGCPECHDRKTRAERLLAPRFHFTSHGARDFSRFQCCANHRLEDVRLPRPPKGVPVLPEVPPVGLTERALIEKHSSDAKCAGCHSRIDPFGFALEGYDADVTAFFRAV